MQLTPVTMKGFNNMNLSDRKLYEGYFDGSAKPNPGKMTIGGFIISPDKNITSPFSVQSITGNGTDRSPAT